MAVSAVTLIWGTLTLGGIGFGALADHFWLEFARVTRSCALGIVLYQVRDSAPRIPFVLSVVLLTLVMLVPPLPGDLDIAFDLQSTFVVLPGIVWTGSSARFPLSGQRLCTSSGDLSYPIYAIHFPLVRLSDVVGTTFHLIMLGRFGFAVAAASVIAAVSAAIFVFVDVPTRRWLTSRSASNRTRRAAPAFERSAHRDLDTPLRATRATRRREPLTIESLNETGASHDPSSSACGSEPSYEVFDRAFTN